MSNPNTLTFLIHFNHIFTKLINAFVSRKYLHSTTTTTLHIRTIRIKRHILTLLTNNINNNNTYQNINHYCHFVFQNQKKKLIANRFSLHNIKTFYVTLMRFFLQFTTIRTYLTTIMISPFPTRIFISLKVFIKPTFMFLFFVLNMQYKP